MRQSELLEFGDKRGEDGFSQFGVRGAREEERSKREETLLIDRLSIAPGGGDGGLDLTPSFDALVPFVEVAVFGWCEDESSPCDGHIGVSLDGYGPNDTVGSSALQPKHVSTTRIPSRV